MNDYNTCRLELSDGVVIAVGIIAITLLLITLIYLEFSTTSSCVQKAIAGNYTAAEIQVICGK